MAAAASSEPNSDMAQNLKDAAALEVKLRQSAASPATAPAAAGGADASVSGAWKSFSAAQLAAIEDARAIVRAQGPLVMDKQHTYGLICRACTKPNSPTVPFCTGPSVTRTLRMPTACVVRKRKHRGVRLASRSSFTPVASFRKRTHASGACCQRHGAAVWAQNKMLCALCLCLRTGCGFPSQPEDVQRLPSNIFLSLVEGQDIGAVVRYRDAQTIVFDDKYACSPDHLDVIPCEVFEDIRVLTREHVPMLERLYELGRAEFLSRNIAWIHIAKQEGQGAQFDIDALITAGYNYPVSVKHLHLHCVLPPFTHAKVFQYPRWHSHAKVLRDLREHGAVRLYADHPNDAEGAAEHQRAMDNWEKVNRWQRLAEEKNAAAAAPAPAPAASESK